MWETLISHTPCAILTNFRFGSSILTLASRGEHLGLKLTRTCQYRSEPGTQSKKIDRPVHRRCHRPLLFLTCFFSILSLFFVNLAIVIFSDPVVQTLKHRTDRPFVCIEKTCNNFFRSSKLAHSLEQAHRFTALAHSGE